MLILLMKTVRLREVPLFVLSLGLKAGLLRPSPVLFPGNSVDKDTLLCLRLCYCI